MLKNGLVGTTALLIGTMLAFTLVGCGTEVVSSSPGNSGGGSNSLVPVTGVTLSADNHNLTVGGPAVNLTATVAPANASNKNITWISSNTGVATVSNNGTVTAISAGTTTIIVSTQDGGKTAVCTITISSPVTGVSLNLKSLALTLGKTATLIATVQPASATRKAVTWHSDNQEVATVDNNGRVIAVSEGTAKITVTTLENSKTVSCTVTVTSAIPAYALVTAVSLSQTAFNLTLYEAPVFLIRTISPSNATNKNVEWISDNPAVATVDTENGLVTAEGGGSATIIVSTQDGGWTAACTVVVTALPLTVNLNLNNLRLPVGGTSNLIAAIQPANAANKAVTWDSSNKAVATVDNNGFVTAVSTGTTTITVTTVEARRRASCIVTVSQPEI